MLIRLLLFIFPVFASKGLHLGTGRVIQWNDTSENPSSIERLRLTVSKAEANGAHLPITVHILRLRWTAPHLWNDNGQEDKRSFNIVCEAQDGTTNESLSLIDIFLSADITSVHERFILADVPLSIICAVRAVNSNGRESDWLYSKLILLGMESTMERATPIEKNKTEDILIPPRAQKENGELDELKKLLSESALEEIPFPKWVKRPPLDLNGTEIEEEAIYLTPTPKQNISLVHVETTMMDDKKAVISTKLLPQTTTKAIPLETTTLEMKNEDVLMEEVIDLSSPSSAENIEEMMKLLEESSMEPIEDKMDNPTKADQIIREPDLFLRGILFKATDLPEESREMEEEQEPFQTGVFDEVETLSPPQLKKKEKEDYDLLEARIREAIGSRVL